MGSPAGGFADKIGNRFEAHYVVAAALELIEGNARSLQWEGVGDAFHGIEYRCCLADGTIEVVQCKSNREKNWTLSALNEEGVLGAIRAQLTAHGAAQYRLVLASRAPELADLVERARAAADSVAFEQSLSNELTTSFSRLRRYWSAGDSPETCVVAHGFLSRLVVQANTTPDFLERHVEMRCGDLFINPAASVRAALREVLESRLGQILTGDDLLTALRADRFKIVLRDWGQLPEAVSAVHALRDRFLSQLGRHLIQGKLIPRKETEAVLKAVLEPDAPKVVLVHGGAGSGKSGVLYELVNLLDTSGVCVVPLRLDNALPSGGGLLGYSREKLGLPDTPDRCASRLAGGKRAVVVVDQLDAVRWAGVHSNPAWDVTLQLLEAAMRSHNISVVVACRTFDVKDDPNLRNWRNAQDLQGRLSEVALKPLETGQVEAVLKAGGHAMPHTYQLGLLRNPLMLWLWCDLTARDADLSGVSAASSLLSAHWANVKSRLAVRHSIPDAAAEDVIARVRETAELRGSLDFSANIVADQRVLDALASESYLDQLAHDRFRVSHQRFLDHQVALSVYRLVVSAKTTVAKWIVSTDQSLARREQIRQVLALLRDDEPHTYASAVRDMLLSDGVREHLRDLVLRLLAECESPLEQEIAIVDQLHRQPSWTRRIRMRCWTTPAWWRVVLDAGHLRDMLMSEEQSDWGWATWTCRRLGETDAEAVASMLSPLVSEHRIELSRLARCLPFNTEHDTAQTALWRFRSQRNGIMRCETYEITHAVKSAPTAALRFAVHILRWGIAHAYRSGLMPKGPPEKFDGWGSGSKGDLVALRQVAATIPRDTWLAVAPILLRSLRFCSRQRRGVEAGKVERLRWDHPCRRLHTVMRMMLEAAAVSMAPEHSSWLWQQLRPFLRLRSRTATRLCVSAIGALRAPVPPQAVEWVTSDLRRLGTYERPYSVQRFWHGRAVIRHLWEEAPEHHERLTKAIVAFRDPAERKHETYRQEYVRTGRPDLVRNLVGLPQYLLLSALPADQLEQTARERLAQWDAKFCTDSRRLRAPRTRRWFLSRPKSWKPPSSWVRLRSMRSLIPTGQLQHVPDRCWIAMASTEWAQRMQVRWKGSDRLSFETPERLAASSFQLAAKSNPARFVRLALRLPVETPDDWFESVLTAAAATEPEPNSAAPYWMAASATDIEACLERMAKRDAKHLTMTLARLERARPTEAWSDETIDRVCEQAVSHPHPTDEESGGHGTLAEMTAENVVNLSVNCVRGVAVEAVERLMWHRPDKRAQFIAVARAAVCDPHPSVRVAAIGLVGPLINDSPDLAIQLLATACGGDDARVLHSFHLDHLLRYLWWRCDTRVEAVVERMATCGIDKVEEDGAIIATVIAVRRERMTAVASLCSEGNPAQRRGVAKALAMLTGTTTEGRRAAAMLREYFNDPDDTVAGAAAQVFRDDDILRSSLGADLALDFVHSDHFAKDPYDLMWPLTEFTGDLLPFQPALAHVVQRAGTDMAELNGDISRAGAMFADKAAECVLRIYERAQGPANAKIREWCLDQIDGLVSSGDNAIDSALKTLHADA